MRTLIAVIATAGLAACAPSPVAQREAVTATAPAPDSAATVLRAEGFLAQRTSPAFAGAVQFVPGAADSTLAIVALSLANSALTFHRAPAGFAATYRVEASFTTPAGTRRLQSEQAVRVGTFAETRRSEESVIFQQTIALAPGEAMINVLVTDVNSGRFSSDQRRVSVPTFAPGRAPALVPVYRATPRSNAGERLDIVANPIAHVSIATDTLRIYYEVADRAEMGARILDESGREVWRGQPVSGPSGVFSILPGELPPGGLRLEGFASGADTTRVAVFPGSGDPWAGGSFVRVLDLLRYHADAASIAAMRAAPDTARSGLWKLFWTSSDPDGATGTHEGLAAYFSRVRSANNQFGEGHTAGWLTDRGEIYIRFGEPLTVTEMGGEMSGRSGGAGCAMSCGSLVWRYERPVPSFIFVFDARLGRYRLDAGSLRELHRYLGNQPTEPAKTPVAKAPGS